MTVKHLVSKNILNQLGAISKINKFTSRVYFAGFGVIDNSVCLSELIILRTSA